MGSPSIPSSESIFISHTHLDKTIADALRIALESLFLSRIKVYYSSDSQRGPQGGEDWFGWINKHVRETDVAIILLTPASLQKPWILWEAGAFAGRSLAGDEKELWRRVRPLIYQISNEFIPEPMRRIQVVRGDNSDEMKSMLEDLIDTSPLLNRAETRDAGQRLAAILSTYLAEVKEALLKAPLLPTEAAVQEWSLRLDQLVEQKRWSEVATLHDWLNVAFGRERTDNPRPLDLRLHRRLGDLYLRAKKWVQAASEFNLARSLSPRDVLILRSLTRAYIEQKDFPAAKKVIEQIKALDADAFLRNAECAAVLGRWHSDQNDLQSARDILATALQQNPDSYYLAELVGQVELDLGNIDAAKARYKQVVDILKRLDERNIWVAAAELNESILSDRSPEIIQQKLQKIRDYHPTPDNLASIDSGLQRIRRGLNMDPSVLTGYILEMRP